MVAKSPVIIAMENAARKAGLELLRYFDDRTRLKVSKKGPGEFVTNADIRSEQILIQELTKLDGSYGFLSEESGLKQANEDSCCWVIDPLDGTTNYIHGLPHYCISLALLSGSLTTHPEFLAALVYAPSLAQLIWAERGKGAYTNDTRLSVSTRTLSDNPLFAGYVSRNPENAVKDIAARSALAANVRIMGSAALELAYVAEGKLDGFWHASLNPWDMAAGILLINEAEGCVSEITGGSNMLQKNNILATNRHLHQEVSNILSRFYGDS